MKFPTLGLGLLLVGAAFASGETAGGSGQHAADATGDFQVAPGFKLEKLYEVPKPQGSWVAMTVDGAGRLICSDQYGKLYRVTPAAAGVAAALTQAEELPIPTGGAHGLLWHRGVLYVSVNEQVGGQGGVWMVEETDGVYGKPRLIKPMSGRGEHGPHALVAAPDGESIYFVAGNFTDLPEMDESLPSRNWAEDQLLPRNPDARGHARNRMAPGGWIARFRPDGSDWTLVATGFRNSYDIAFNDDGELFAYDADMEWDFGMPWYRPTRINHVVPGAEFGWRNGTGKWPAYYEDSMPAVINIGPGSPTALLHGKGLAFPAKYQKALFAFDWTFATIYAIHLSPDRAGYSAESEELVAGAGLPLTDAVVGPDGAMYFATGGRRTGSTLWRVTYHGDESTAPAAPTLRSDGRLEFLKSSVDTPALDALDQIWRELGADDRTLRFVARAAIERLPVSLWSQQLDTESDPWRVIGAVIALARNGDEDQRQRSLAALDRLDWATLSKQQRLNWLRAAGLVFIRTGEPTAEERAVVLAKIDAAFPAGDYDLDAELCRMLSYLQAPGVVGRTLALMDTYGETELPDWAGLIERNDRYGSDIAKMMANHPPTGQVHFIYCLRVVRGPWEIAERQAVFDWFRDVSTRDGGRSYRGFLDALRRDLMANATDDERVRFAADAAAPAEPVLENLPPVEGPGRAWTVEEVVALTEDGLEGRDTERGQRMYLASLCAACHRFGGEGGASGPDLTTAGGRFTVRDLAEAIIDPGKVISDQYAFEQIRKHGGASIVGKILNEQDEVLSIAINPFDMSQTIEIPRSEVSEVLPSPVSPMPPSLINRLNPEELKDLFAFILGGE